MHKSKVPFSDGLVGLHLFNPVFGKTQPLIIMFPAFEGHSEFIITYAHRVVDHGFQVYIADMYGSGIAHKTLEASFSALEPLKTDRSKVRKLVLENIEAATKAADVDLDTTGIMGFCFGGMCALEAARANINAPAFFCAHGNLEKDPELTSSFAKNINIQLAQGYSDPLVNADQLKSFSQEMSAVNWSCTFYGNTKHSFTDHNVGLMDPVEEAKIGREYHPLNAELCFQQAVCFFEMYL